jgi:hypothetical protein
MAWARSKVSDAILLKSIEIALEKLGPPESFSNLLEFLDKLLYYYFYFTNHLFSYLRFI